VKKNSLTPIHSMSGSWWVHGFLDVNGWSVNG
jgi:hypothetical protein